jgi:hypothetical protein
MCNQKSVAYILQNIFEITLLFTAQLLYLYIFLSIDGMSGHFSFRKIHSDTVKERYVVEAS